MRFLRRPEIFDRLAQKPILPFFPAIKHILSRPPRETRPFCLEGKIILHYRRDPIAAFLPVRPSVRPRFIARITGEVLLVRQFTPEQTTNYYYCCCIDISSSDQRRCRFRGSINVQDFTERITRLHDRIQVRRKLSSLYTGVVFVKIKTPTVFARYPIAISVSPN